MASQNRDDAFAPDDADFESLPAATGCPHCLLSEERPFTGVDAIYCISLREQPARAATAAAQFHRFGLCRAIVMYRPSRGVHVTMAIWRSHRAVALHARRHGRERILVFEDDAAIEAPLSEIKARVAKAIEQLPGDWWGLFLGHFPFQAFNVAPGLLRVRSGCLHAYIANTPLLTWLRQTEPMDPSVSTCWLGEPIDSAVANLPGMYALDPMIATQRRFADIRPDTAADLRGPLSWAWWRGRRERAFIYGLMRPGAFVVKLAAPLHRATLERLRLRLSRRQMEARLVKDSGLFDVDFYLARYSDIAAADLNPLRHFMAYGAMEGRWPNPLFDGGYYLDAHPDLRRLRINPLIHFIARGASEGSSPHKDFNPAAYLDANPGLASAGVNPLAHFLRSRKRG